MAQIVIIDLEETVKLRLEQRALKHGRSMDEEVRHILRDAAKQPVDQVLGLGTRIATLFREADFAFEIPELRWARLTYRPKRLGWWCNRWSVTWRCLPPVRSSTS